MEELLTDWGCVSLIDVFKVNEINIDNMYELTPELIKELIPKIGLRMKFMSNFKNHGFQAVEQPQLESDAATDTQHTSNINNLDVLETRSDTSLGLTNSSSGANTIILPLDDSFTSVEDYFVVSSFPDFDLKTLVSTSPIGLNILQFYAKNQTLDSKKRSQLTDLIIKHIFNYVSKHRLNHEEYNIITSKIIGLFPSESAGVYYIPAVKKINSPTGRSLLAKGKLVDKCRNLLHNCADVVIQKLRKSNSDEVEILSKKRTIDITDELQNNITWLNTRTEPWSDVIEKWKATYEVRHCSSAQTVHQFIEEWSILKDLRSDVLINLDFEKIHPYATLKLILNWDTFFERILENKKCNLKDSHATHLLTLIENDDISEDAKFAIQLLTLPYLVPPKGRIKVDNKHWKFSTIETADAIICHAKIPGDINNIIDIQKEKASLRKQQVQPYLIIEGPTLKEIRKVYVIVDELRYQFESSKKAFDTCFKLFHVMNASYPPQAEHIWLLIQRGVTQDLIDILVNKTVTSNVNQNDTLKKFFENLFKINALNNEFNLNACLEVKHMKKEISNLENLNGHLEERIKDQTLIINLLTNEENYNIRNNGNLENCKQFTNTLSYAGVLSHDSKQEVKQSQFLNLNTTGSKLCKETVMNHVTPINEANYKSTSKNTKLHKFLSNSIGYPSTSTTVVNNNEVLTIIKDVNVISFLEPQLEIRRNDCRRTYPNLQFTFLSLP
ncbi:hypothetical protein RN001_002996 [Aquatica leii]|uniref:SAM domain-containing protein n=1 Tax=Aquatica leii TaxID=1421715 RepID=A0AAN7SSY1_9COLE|nr:hypothetical protein RN001_002996 [Aquatica leii]